MIHIGLCSPFISFTIGLIFQVQVYKVGLSSAAVQLPTRSRRAGVPDEIRSAANDTWPRPLQPSATTIIPFLFTHPHIQSLMGRAPVSFVQNNCISNTILLILFHASSTQYMFSMLRLLGFPLRLVVSSVSIIGCLEY